MKKRLLICAIGQSRERVATALREIGHDKLVAITTEPNTLAIKDAEKFEDLACAEYEVVKLADKHNFDAMFSAFVKTIEKHRGWDIRVNISGGPKLLTIAGMFACYSYGVSIYHCEDRVHRLPVIKEVGFLDILTPDARIVLQSLGKRAENIDAISTNTRLNKNKVEDALKILKRFGLAVVTKEKGGIFGKVSSKGAIYQLSIRPPKPFPSHSR